MAITGKSKVLQLYLRPVPQRELKSDTDSQNNPVAWEVISHSEEATCMVLLYGCNVSVELPSKYLVMVIDHCGCQAELISIRKAPEQEIFTVAL